VAGSGTAVVGSMVLVDSPAFADTALTGPAVVGSSMVLVDSSAFADAALTGPADCVVEKRSLGRDTLEKNFPVTLTGDRCLPNVR
jgi:hypothetical protein